MINIVTTPINNPMKNTEIHFSDQDRKILRSMKEENLSLSREYKNVKKDFSENGNFILGYKSNWTLERIEQYDNYHDLKNHYESIRLKNIIISISKFAFFFIAASLYDINVYVSVIISFFCCLFTPFGMGSKESDESVDMLFYLRGQKERVELMYSLRDRIAKNTESIIQKSGQKIIDFVESQPIVSIESIHKQVFECISSEIIELIMNHEIEEGKFKKIETANPTNPNLKMFIYKKITN